MKTVTSVGDQRNPLVHLFGITWRFSKGQRRNIFLIWFMFLTGNTLAFIVEPLIMARILNIIQTQGITMEATYNIARLLTVIIGIEIVFWALHGPARVLERVTAFRVRANYRRFLLGGVLNLPLGWHAGHHTGDTVDKVEKGANAQYAFASESFNIISSIAQLVVSFVMLTYISWTSAIIVSVMIGTTIFITAQFDRRIIENYKSLNRAENNASESIFDTISNVTTVIILRVEKLVFSAISRKLDAPMALYRKNSIQIETKWFLVAMCCKIMMATVLVTYCLMQLRANSVVVIGSVYLLIKYLDQINDLFFRFTGMYGEIIQRHAKVLNSEILERDFHEVALTGHMLPIAWRTIDVRNLSFSYEGNGDGELHLDGVSLSLRRGERIALVGKSGSGKTTFLKIMRGLYDPVSCDLSVDGAPVHDGFNSISRDITLVPQLPEIFATTIRENITLGADYDEELIWHCIRLARFEEAVTALPKGLESAINEKGVNLSGGQQQRLALARGLLACMGKSLILLDEPTSNVDGTNEAAIYQNIRDEFGNATIFASIHGLHLLKHFDRIVVFDKGAIVGTGSKEELLADCPQFRELWQNYERTAQKGTS